MSITRDCHADIVFALPCTFPVLLSPSLDGMPHPSSLLAVWPNLEDLDGEQLSHTAIALPRFRSFFQPTSFLHARVGIREGPQPVTPHRHATAHRLYDLQPCALAPSGTRIS